MVIEAELHYLGARAIRNDENHDGDVDRPESRRAGTLDGGYPRLDPPHSVRRCRCAAVPAGFGVSVLMSLKFNTVLNSMLNSPKFCQR